MASRPLDFYQSRDKIQQPGLSDVSLPEIGDIGPTIQRTARGLLDQAEPYAREAAEKQALEDAGSAYIGKDENGNYVRTNLTQGGGLVYARAYSQALDVRQTVLMSQDYEAKLNELGATYRRDPAAFGAAAAGVAEGMLEQAPPTIRARLEDNFGREMLERVRGISTRTAEENHGNMVRDLENIMSTSVMLEQQIVGQGLQPEELQKAIAPLVQRRAEAKQALEQLGEWSPEREIAFNQEHGARLYDPLTYARSAQSMRELEPVLKEYSSFDNLDELRRIELWLGGVAPEDPTEKLGGLTFQEWQDAFPHPGVRSQARSIINTQADRIEQNHYREIAEAKAAALENQPPTAPEIIKAFKDNNYIPQLGYSIEETAQRYQQVMQWGPIADQLQDPEQRQRLMGWINEYGIIPPEFSQIAEGWMGGTHMPDAVDLIQNVRNFQVKGVEVGRLWYNSLPAPVRAAYDRDEALRRGGISDPATRQAAIMGAMQGKTPPMPQVWDAMGGRDKYNERVRGALAVALRQKPEVINYMRGSQIFKDDFDELLQANFMLNGGSFEQAFQSAVKQATNAWAPSRLFAHGIGDARVVAQGLDVGVMNGILRGTKLFSGANPSGAQFGQTDVNGRPRVVMEQMDAAPGKLFGQYRMSFYDQEGQPAGSAFFSMDQFLAAHGGTRRRVIEAQRTAAKAAAEPPRDILSKDDKGFIQRRVNPEWQAWKARKDREAAGIKSKLDDQLERYRRETGDPGYLRI